MGQPGAQLGLLAHRRSLAQPRGLRARRYGRDLPRAHHAALRIWAGHRRDGDPRAQRGADQPAQRASRALGARQPAPVLCGGDPFGAILPRSPIAAGRRGDEHNLCHHVVQDRAIRATAARPALQGTRCHRPRPGGDSGRVHGRICGGRISVLDARLRRGARRAALDGSALAAEAPAVGVAAAEVAEARHDAELRRPHIPPWLVRLGKRGFPGSRAGPGKRCRGYAHVLLRERESVGDGRSRDGLAAWGSHHCLAALPACVLQDRAVPQGIPPGAVACAERDRADGGRGARGRGALRQCMDSEPATGCSSCGGGDQLWARLSAVAPGAAHGILRARRGCARQTRGVSVTTPAGEGPSDTRRLLVITYDFGPDGPVGGLRWAGITKYLARLGWDVCVLTAAPPFGGAAAIGVQVERCARLWTVGDGYRLVRRLIFGESLGLSRSISHGGPPGGRPRDLLRQLRNEVATFLSLPDESHGWMLRAALRARSVIRRFQPRVVVSSGPPHSAHLVAAMATIRSPAEWLIDLRDPWAGPLPKVWQSHRRLGTRVFRAIAPRLERLAFGVADGVIANTPQLAAVLAAKYPNVPVVCVPNGVDPDGVPPPARHRYPGLSIAYTGRLYAGRDLGPVMRALGIFFQHHPEAARAGSKLRIAGDADSRHAQVFNDAVAVAGVEQYVEVLGLLSRADALDVVSRSRLAVVLAQDQELQIPAKLYESVAMGVPTLVVAPAGSAAAVEGTRLGAVVRDSGDVEGIACVLERLWQDGSPERSSCPVPITYDAIALLVDQVLGMSLPPASARQGVLARL